MTENPQLKHKAQIMNIIGWVLLLIGIILYILPVAFEWLGHYSGLLAFVFIFCGITLLKLRKDQLNR
ncbi:hypothetical protein [Aliikangiella maris]|uniref:Uncharacterized protein n=2 Tax=Aliikangiella maris TaxID=3162458 RepID=A0ABV2BV98_9GAMM